jgi:hypothetical protein
VLKKCSCLFEDLCKMHGANKAGLWVSQEICASAAVDLNQKIPSGGGKLKA